MAERKKCAPECNCGRHHHIVRTRYEKQCVECGAGFTAKRADTRYCSGDCHRKAYERANREHIREIKRDYQQRHREHERARNAEWQSDPANAERGRERKRLLAGEVKADPERAAIQRERNKAYYQKNRDRLLEQARQKRLREGNAAKYRSQHGADWDDIFTAFWEAQEGKCYLCGAGLDREGDRAIHLDHDHSCCPLGRTCERCRRGLACKNCNHILGIAKDDFAQLRRIADALERASLEVAERMRKPRAAREGVVYEVACRECGSAFTATRRDAIFCSSKCYDKYRHRERRAKPDHPRTCRVCGEQFTGASWATYCSLACSGRASRIRRGLRVESLVPTVGETPS